MVDLKLSHFCIGLQFSKKCICVSSSSNWKTLCSFSYISFWLHMNFDLCENTIFIFLWLHCTALQFLNLLDSNTFVFLYDKQSWCSLLFSILQTAYYYFIQKNEKPYCKLLFPSFFSARHSLLIFNSQKHCKKCKHIYSSFAYILMEIHSYSVPQAHQFSS